MRWNVKRKKEVMKHRMMQFEIRLMWRNFRAIFDGKIIHSFWSQHALWETVIWLGNTADERKQKTENRKQKTENRKQKKHTMQGVEVIVGVEGKNQFSPPAPSVWYVWIHRPLKASKVRSTQQDSLSVSVWMVTLKRGGIVHEREGKSGKNRSVWRGYDTGKLKILTSFHRK